MMMKIIMPKLLVSSSLFGDEVVEFLLGDDTVTIGVSSLDHFLEDVVVGELSKVLGDFSEVLEGNEAGFLGVEGDEDLVHFVSALVVGGPSGHHVEELGELNLSAAVAVEFGDHLIDGLGLGLDSEGVDGNFQF